MCCANSPERTRTSVSGSIDFRSGLEPWITGSRCDPLLSPISSSPGLKLEFRAGLAGEELERSTEGIGPGEMGNSGVLPPRQILLAFVLDGLMSVDRLGAQAVGHQTLLFMLRLSVVELVSGEGREGAECIFLQRVRGRVGVGFSDFMSEADFLTTTSLTRPSKVTLFCGAGRELVLPVPPQWCRIWAGFIAEGTPLPTGEFSFSLTSGRSPFRGTSSRVSPARSACGSSLLREAHAERGCMGLQACSCARERENWWVGSLRGLLELELGGGESFWEIICPVISESKSAILRPGESWFGLALSRVFCSVVSCSKNVSSSLLTEETEEEEDMFFGRDRLGGTCL